MNLFSLFHRTKVQSIIPQQVISKSWEEREAILDPSVNLFCWIRPVDDEIHNYLRVLLEKQLLPIQFHTHVADLKENIDQKRLMWDGNPLGGANKFWNDILFLVKDFLNLSINKSGTVHLKVIENNACTNFHTDGYWLRLFTTYYGKGTEWLPESATNRNGLGKRNELTVKDSSQINRMQPFDVGLLKGETPEANILTKGIVHRSPEIEHINGKRIILRVDL